MVGNIIGICGTNHLILSWVRRLIPEHQMNRKPEDQKMTKGPKVQKNIRSEKVDNGFLLDFY